MRNEKQAVKWMDSITGAMGTQLENVKDQIGDRSPWKKMCDY